MSEFIKWIKKDPPKNKVPHKVRSKSREERRAKWKENTKTKTGQIRCKSVLVEEYKNPSIKSFKNESDQSDLLRLRSAL